MSGDTEGMTATEKLVVMAKRQAQQMRDLATARAERDEAIRALQPFGAFAEGFGPHAREDSWVLCENLSRTKRITMGDVRQARAILSKHPKVTT